MNRKQKSNKIDFIFFLLLTDFTNITRRFISNWKPWLSLTTWAVNPLQDLSRAKPFTIPVHLKYQFNWVPGDSIVSTWNVFFFDIFIILIFYFFIRFRIRTWQELITTSSILSQSNNTKLSVIQSEVKGLDCSQLKSGPPAFPRRPLVTKLPQGLMRFSVSASRYYNR